MPSLADLIKPTTKDGWVARFIGFFQAADFPARAWQPLSFLRWTVESESSLLAEAGLVVSEIAKGMHARTAKGPWLDLLAENVFADKRKPAVHTVGEVLLTDVASVGPVTISVGQQWFANGSKTLRYVVHALPYGTSVPLNGSLRVQVRAELAGAVYNVGVNAISQLITSIPGVTVGNPAIGDTGTWILTQGVDEEKDPQLLSRLLDKWATLGTGANDGAYRYYALSASPEVTRARVYSPGGGSVRVVVAGPSGPVSGAALTAVQTAIAARRPTGVPDVVASNATTLSVTIGGTLYLRRGQDPVARLAAAQAACDEYARTHEISEDLSRERVIRDLFVDGVRDLTLTSPAADVSIAEGQIYVPTFALTAVVDT